ncbi:DUF1294 domain-containing protein [Paenibacillus terrigena]|uniref:DUF1294 domain-containing protein n=1 Tax=Paenibacillus terrigena TaxID=369333 RepID=UPI001FE09E11|nr:DUF1294 domain-containing protein [Paenibacillus terrigena]
MVYLLMNIISYQVMAADKVRAKKYRQRVPERTLFTLAALGGGLGSMLAMQRKRHKTKHWSFRLGMPLLFLVNVIVYGYLFQAV